jgi:hypothetical protein
MEVILRAEKHRRETKLGFLNTTTQVLQEEEFLKPEHEWPPQKRIGDYLVSFEP